MQRPATASCLTAQQLEAVTAANTDIRNSPGELLYPRLPVVNSAGASPPEPPKPGGQDVHMFRHIANQNPAWSEWAQSKQLAFSLHGPRRGPLRRRHGPDRFNALAPPERWREQNDPPKYFTATRVNERGAIDMTRPLCPYPQQAAH